MPKYVRDSVMSYYPPMTNTWLDFWQRIKCDVTAASVTPLSAALNDEPAPEDHRCGGAVGWLVRRPAVGSSGCLRVPLHRSGVRSRRSARCVPPRIVALFPNVSRPDDRSVAGCSRPSAASATRVAPSLRSVVLYARFLRDCIVPTPRCPLDRAREILPTPLSPKISRPAV